MAYIKSSTHGVRQSGILLKHGKTLTGADSTTL